MNVLFVDDETRVLDGIRRALFDADDSWNIMCAPSATAALATMEENPVDLIVSDMRMPEHDGAWLLTEVMRRHPECIRYVLSGQTDEADALRAIKVTHQFLRKPCPPEALQQALANAAHLIGLTRDPRLRTIVGSVDNLPTIPSTGLEVQRLIDTERGDIAQIATLVERDPVLSAKILQVVNSSFFSRPEPVHELRKAIAVVGVHLVARIAMLVGTWQGEANHPKCNIESLRRHALLASVIAKILSPRPNDEQAATSALLCDIGELVLAQQPNASCDQKLGVDGERTAYGCDHAEISAYLIALWGLPREIVSAVAEHHAPLTLEAVAGGELGAVVTLAHVIADGREVPDELRRDPAVAARIDAAIAANARGASAWDV